LGLLQLSLAESTCGLGFSGGASVTTVATDAFKKRLNYDPKEINQNRENICGDKTQGYVQAINFL
jgi:hypothetical protein